MRFILIFAAILPFIEQLFASDPSKADFDKEDQWANTFLGKNIWNKDEDHDESHQFSDNYDQQQSLKTTNVPAIEMIAGTKKNFQPISFSSSSQHTTGNGRIIDDTVTVPFESPAYLHCRIRNRGPNEVVWIRLSDEKILTIGTETFTDDKRFQLSYRREPNGLEDMLLIIRYTQLNDSGSYECQVPADQPHRLTVKLIVLGNALESQMIGDRPMVEKRERSALVNNMCKKRQCFQYKMIQKNRSALYSWGLSVNLYPIHLIVAVREKYMFKQNCSYASPASLLFGKRPQRVDEQHNKKDVDEFCNQITEVLCM